MDSAAWQAVGSSEEFIWPKMIRNMHIDQTNDVQKIIMRAGEIISKHTSLAISYDSVIALSEISLHGYKLEEFSEKAPDLIILGAVALILKRRCKHLERVIACLWENKESLKNCLATNSIKELDAFIESVVKILSIREDVETYEEIKSTIYELMANEGERTVALYRSVVENAANSSSSAEDYRDRILVHERNMEFPQFIYKPRPVFELDRNGFRIRIFTGDSLSNNEKTAISIYRFCQYASPDIDHDTSTMDLEKLPFFDSETIYSDKLYMEPLSVFSSLSSEYHVIITDEMGKIVGYVCLESPLCEDDPSVRFGDKRPPHQLYPCEKVFGADTLIELAQELTNTPINHAVDIVRLIPRANASMTELPNRERVIIAFELALAMTQLIDRLIDSGRHFVICDTELEKVGQIFRFLLGIEPKHIERKPDLQSLPPPYDRLLEPRYRNDDRRNRIVAVVAFELSALLEDRSVERRMQINEILRAYSAASDVNKKKEIMGNLFATGLDQQHIITTKLGREVDLGTRAPKFALDNVEA